MWGIFDENLVKKHFYKMSSGKPETLLSIEEIADQVIRLDPETAQFDIDALDEMEAYLKSKNTDDGFTDPGFDKIEKQESREPIMNLLHCFQNTIPIKHERFK